ncbi:MAG: 30S ribosomal protein S1 [Rubinisphaera brasiliensis]|uniref:30S ribosomal protein S1 n=1 Tax=Rubinisphaera brasiliensis (strain ATCC 49424 / DSM 5305 / JCM 21570 / IAM 15109 / NBRC 103401 / IFAM 1448) TaxID=756272 RepID=F0SHN6_RUBBR|nr:30S ribosomal protein S1 [Rubinisphaera brasiliensis]ADY58474.1 SSU ribosomal protein S1P [Rubinisphaera brasiliensis DSM 5305]MBB03154.1 30S ribosomal protein S1 [Planctomyces sp.]MBR9801707.1 30S ribosomal protein S1 [bacterium]
MVDRNLLREFSINDDELESFMGGSLAELVGDEVEMDALYDETSRTFDANEIVQGKIIRVDDDEVLVDVGFKSEGLVLREEWEEGEPDPEIGQTIEVLLEDIEDIHGVILLSKRKADRIREWERIIARCDEGDIITGTVVRKIKGGLLVNIGVNVFLPASQVDIRRPNDIADFIGQEIECIILKIDEPRRNIVVSRRKLIEDRRAELKRKLLEELEEGQLRTGVVKNIADFGAFVDLGGIDGLLHITDMSWGRIDHPSNMVSIDDEIEVVILNVDREKEKIALGLKQKTKSPWENIGDKYPVGSRVTGEVTNVMSYGAFVRLEDGIEGLVHISEMSWTRRINHPSELVNIGDSVDVVVLNINTDKQEISLGMKQTQPNPWDNVGEKYPVGAVVKGKVRNLTNYGAFIELEEGVDGLLHVSDMSWTRKISHASEMLKKGDEVECQIVSVDEERRRIALGLKQLQGDPWTDTIPDKYAPGTIVTGNVTKITNFGVFVELEPELEGLLHVSELAAHKVNNPEDEVNVGESIEVRILRLDLDDRKIGLSRRLDGESEEVVVEESGRVVSSPGDLKGGTGDSGPLFQMPSAMAEAESEPEAEAEEKDEEAPGNE